MSVERTSEIDFAAPGILKPPFEHFIFEAANFYAQEIVLAPTAVNKKKGKNRKTKLMDYIRVRMSEAVKTFVGGTEPSGTTRRPQWRRGHIRRCRSGRIVPVQPCMVNWNGEKIEPKLYKVAA
jgi:hypothetical protein